jgi:hypothetical protein
LFLGLTLDPCQSPERGKEAQAGKDADLSGDPPYGLLISLHKMRFSLGQKVLDPIGGLMIIFQVTGYAF